MFSLFVLALYVFLQSAPAFKWFTVDPKLTAFIGIVFVVAVVVESLLLATGRIPQWHWLRRNNQPGA